MILNFIKNYIKIDEDYLFIIYRLVWILRAYKVTLGITNIIVHSFFNKVINIRNIKTYPFCKNISDKLLQKGDVHID